MNLKTYNRESQPTHREALPALSYAEVGTIFLNGSLCDLMGLKPGDGLSLHQSEEDPMEWYVSKDAQGYVLRPPHNRDKRGLLVGAMAVRNRMKAALEENEPGNYTSGRMLVARVPVKHGKELLYPILTSSFTHVGRGRKREK